MGYNVLDLNKQIVNAQCITAKEHADSDSHNNGSSSADYHAVGLVVADALGGKT